MSDSNQPKGIPAVVDNHYFKLDSVTNDKFKAVCLKCPEGNQKVISCDLKINSNLIRHLKTQHPEVHTVYKIASENARKRKSVTPEPTVPEKICKQDEANKLVASFIIETCQAVNVVKSKSFKKMVAGLTGE